MENYPIFDNEYVIERNSDVHNQFEKHLNYTDGLVDFVQFNSNIRKEVPLSFYPIARNIRGPSSYMAVNILNNCSSYIDNMPRNGELDFWNDYKKMGDWFPWLWARGRVDDKFKNIDGWKYYFDSFTEKHNKTENRQPLVKPPDNLMLLFTYLSCIKYTFQLNNKYSSIMDDYKNQMSWPVGSKILAVQIRRGETCTKDGSITDRPFYNLHKYIDKIEKMLVANHYDSIYISTDSDEEIGELKKLRPEWKLLYLPIDRKQFFRIKEQPVDLEVFCALEPDRIPFIVDSGLADLYFISQCQGYISTISFSEFSRCGWFLQMATQRKITPYINMNEEPLDMTKRDKLLLL